MDNVLQEMEEMQSKIKSDNFENDKRLYNSYPDKTHMLWVVDGDNTNLFVLQSRSIDKDNIKLQVHTIKTASPDAEFYYLSKNTYLSDISRQEALRSIARSIDLTLDSIPPGKVIEMTSVTESKETEKYRFVAMGGVRFTRIQMNDNSPLVVGVSQFYKTRMKQLVLYADNVKTLSGIEFPKYERDKLSSNVIFEKSNPTLNKKDQKIYDEAENGTKFLRVVSKTGVSLYPVVDITCDEETKKKRMMSMRASGASVYMDIKGGEMYEILLQRGLEAVIDSRKKAFENLNDGSVLNSDGNIYIKDKDKIKLLVKDGTKYSVDNQEINLDTLKKDVKTSERFSKKDLEMLRNGEKVKMWTAKEIEIQMGDRGSMSHTM